MMLNEMIQDKGNGVTVVWDSVGVRVKADGKTAGFLRYEDWSGKWVPYLGNAEKAERLYEMVDGTRRQTTAVNALVKAVKRAHGR